MMSKDVCKNMIWICLVLLVTSILILWCIYNADSIDEWSSKIIRRQASEQQWQQQQE
jgi:di/tricarboxylate transporter